MVVSGLPHHVTQRGNRRESIFFEDGDQEISGIFLGSRRVRRTYLLLANERPCE
jgi:REP element-mobilizing transposase RayT